MATAPSPNDLTRQQLDELDALLQRMLSVPLAPAETPMPAATQPPAPTPPLWRVDPPAPVSVSSPHLLLPDPPPSSIKIDAPPTPLAPAPSPPPSPVPPPKPTATPPSAMPVLPPIAPSGTTRSELSTPTRTVPATKAPPAPVAPAPVPKPPASLTPVPAAPPVPVLFLPFVVINAIFDTLCGLFGPPGRLLRSGFFKHVYGLIGLGLLLYTAAHFAQAKEWLTLPMPLPWPQ